MEKNAKLSKKQYMSGRSRLKSPECYCFK